MKLFNKIKINKIHTMYDNEHYCIKFRFLRRPQKLFFQSFFKNTQFSMKIYPLKMKSQIKTDDRFF